MFGEKQTEFLLTPLPRLTIVEGCISSGKTFLCNHKAVSHIAKNVTGRGQILFVGKTLETLERNVLEPLAIAYRGKFDYSKGAKRASLNGRHIELEGCSDSRAEHKIRGMTLEFVYGDELTLWNREFFTRCLGGLRVPGAAFLGTTNPDTPAHFLYADFLRRKEELGLLNPHFTMDDNPSLTPEYRRQVEKEYSGVLHDRFIKGLWTFATGSIYQPFLRDTRAFFLEKPPRDIEVVSIGVDFGGSKSKTAFVATGFTSGFAQAHVLMEQCREAALEDPEGLAESFADFCEAVRRRWPRIHRVYADSAEQYLIRGLRSALRRRGLSITVVNAWKKPIHERVRFLLSLMGRGRFFLQKDCEELKQALLAAAWEEGSLTDTRLDNGSYNMDVIDAMEYSIEPYMEYLRKETGKDAVARRGKLG